MPSDLSMNCSVTGRLVGDDERESDGVADHCGEVNGASVAYIEFCPACNKNTIAWLGISVTINNKEWSKNRRTL